MCTEARMLHKQWEVLALFKTWTLSVARLQKTESIREATEAPEAPESIREAPKFIRAAIELHPRAFPCASS